VNCPWCDFKFRILCANAAEIPDIAPVLCEDCGEISLLIRGEIQKATPEELEQIKTSPAWNLLGPVQAFILRRKKARNAVNN